MWYCKIETFLLILTWFFIGYWILKRGWIFILALFLYFTLGHARYLLHWLIPERFTASLLNLHWVK